MLLFHQLSQHHVLGALTAPGEQAPLHGHTADAQQLSPEAHTARRGFH